MAVFAGSFIAAGEAQAPKPQKNLIQNGDFSDGATHWRGEGKVDVFKSDPADAPKGGAGPDVAKSPEKPSTPPPSSLTLPPRPPLAGAPGKPAAGVDRSYCVTLGSRSANFYQSVSVPRNAKALKITFRAQAAAGFLTSKGALGAFRILIVRPDRSDTYDDGKLEAKPGWQTFTETFETKDARSVDVKIEVYPGSGQIYFDDFVVEAV